jgi:pyruvate dehydrogenase complex dehydrogenase (E1) component
MVSQISVAELQQPERSYRNSQAIRQGNGIYKCARHQTKKKKNKTNLVASGAR